MGSIAAAITYLTSFLEFAQRERQIHLRYELKKRIKTGSGRHRIPERMVKFVSIKYSELSREVISDTSLQGVNQQKF